MCLVMLHSMLFPSTLCRHSFSFFCFVFIHDAAAVFCLLVLLGDCSSAHCSLECSPIDHNLFNDPLPFSINH